jgi:excisionase family DNA binding protein
MSMAKPEKAPDETGEGFARIPEACDFLALSRASIYSLMDAGELQYAKIGRCRRIPWRVLRAFAERCLIGAK